MAKNGTLGIREGEDDAIFVTEFLSADMDGDRAYGFKDVGCGSSRDVSGRAAHEWKHSVLWDTFQSALEELEVSESLMTCGSEHWKLRDDLLLEVLSTIS